MFIVLRSDLTDFPRQRIVVLISCTDVCRGGMAMARLLKMCLPKWESDVKITHLDLNCTVQGKQLVVVEVYDHWILQIVV